MRISPQHVQRLERFLDRIKGETYAEPISAGHAQITAGMLPQVIELSGLKQPRVLDVGCGQGVALKLFRERGFAAVGITVNDDDLRVCRELGFEVREMDQSFLDFEPGSFELIWCRHCLEHSIFPYFTLAGFHEVLTQGGWLYVEVPAPGTACRHETNQNHYSVLTKPMWVSLFERSGFRVHALSDSNFPTNMGPDTYWSFLLQREELRPVSKERDIS